MYNIKENKYVRKIFVLFYVTVIIVYSIPVVYCICCFSSNQIAVFFPEKTTLIVPTEEHTYQKENKMSVINDLNLDDIDFNISFYEKLYFKS